MNDNFVNEQINFFKIEKKNEKIRTRLFLPHGDKFIIREIGIPERELIFILRQYIQTTEIYIFRSMMIDSCGVTSQKGN